VAYDRWIEEKTWVGILMVRSSVSIFSANFENDIWVLDRHGFTNFCTRNCHFDSKLWKWHFYPLIFRGRDPLRL